MSPRFAYEPERARIHPLPSRSTSSGTAGFLSAQGKGLAAP